MPKYCLLHPQWHVSSKSLIISCLENADSCFPVPGCASVELTPPILIHRYLFKMWNLITSLPRLKRFSCFPACQSHCKSLKCMFRLLISWPPSPAPLLESNASSRTSYASKKKNLHIKFPEIRVLVYRMSGGDVFTESNVNGTPGDGHGGARRSGEVAYNWPELALSLSNPHLCDPQASAWASLLLSTPLIIQEATRHQPQRPRHAGFPPIKGSSHCSRCPGYLFVGGSTILNEWSPPPGGADDATLLLVCPWSPPHSLAAVPNYVYCLNQKQANEAMHCSCPSPFSHSRHSLIKDSGDRQCPQQQKRRVRNGETHLHVFFDLFLLVS